jgi:hypothetical protein
MTLKNMRQAYMRTQLFPEHSSKNPRKNEKGKERERDGRKEKPEMNLRNFFFSYNKLILITSVHN